MTIRQFCIDNSEPMPIPGSLNRRTARGLRRKYRALKREQAEARNARTPVSRKSKKKSAATKGK